MVIYKFSSHCSKIIFNVPSNVLKTNWNAYGCSISWVFWCYDIIYYDNLISYALITWKWNNDKSDVYRELIDKFGYEL